MLLHITSRKAPLIVEFQGDLPGVWQGNVQGKVSSPHNLILILS